MGSTKQFQAMIDILFKIHSCNHIVQDVYIVNYSMSYKIKYLHLTTMMQIGMHSAL